MKSKETRPKKQTLDRDTAMYTYTTYAHLCKSCTPTHRDKTGHYTKLVPKQEGIDPDDAMYTYTTYTRRNTLYTPFTEMKQSHYTKLVPKLEGIDPDDAFSAVPYEKGAFA